jgi:hypothetical protein
VASWIAATRVQDEWEIAVGREGRALGLGIDPLQRIFQLGDVEVDLPVRRPELLHVLVELEPADPQPLGVLEQVGVQALALGGVGV